MKYKPLKSLYHVYNSSEYSAELAKRKSSYATFNLGIDIKDFKTKAENPAFVVCDWEMMCLIESMGKHSMKINSSLMALPQVAQNYYVKKCLTDEIQMTNDIEGIYSTRKEINETIDSIHDERQKSRFSGMIRKYTIMMDKQGDGIPLFTSSDVRKLYNEIVLEEVAHNDYPDGTIFRKERVFVASRKAGQKEHEGVFPESKIIDYMEKSLDILRNDEIPLLVRVSIFHYLFGYIHPFYDGNGRTNRFISSYVLLREYNPLIGLSISRILKENREAYYKSFRLCNEAKNAGDTTPFVISFLSFIEKAAESVRENLETGVAQMEYYKSMVHRNVYVMEFKDKEKADIYNILMLFVQNALFADDPFTLNELARYSSKSEPTIKKNINRLTESIGVPIIEEGTRPIHYRIDLDQFDAFLRELDEKNKQLK